MSNPVLSNRWWVVAASVSGLLVGSGTIGFFTFGLFLKPITAEMGWSRGVLASAVGLGSLLLAVLSPVFGRMFDRWGLRRVGLPSIAVFALATASLSLVPRVLWVFILVQMLATVASVAQTPVMYSKAITAWFTNQRGLALGIATAGVGLGAAIMPQAARLLIEHDGWRAAYVGLGVLIFLLAFAPVAVFIRMPDQKVAVPAVPRFSAESIGASLSEACRTKSFWLIAGAFLLGATAINGTIAHLVPMLSDRGISVRLATAALSSAGVALIVGRVLTGALLDRFFAPYVAAIMFLLPLIGVLLLASGADGVVLLVGAVLCGIGVGADFDLLGYLVGRYFGLRSYAEILGSLFGIFIVGTGLGPVAMGFSFDLAHSYNVALIGFAAALAIGGVLLLTLGPYRYDAAVTSADGADTGAVVTSHRELRS